MDGSSRSDIVVQTTEPTNTKPKFIAAQKQHHEYKSYDQKPLKVGDKVYQISFIENTYTPIVKEFQVSEKLSDGRIKISTITRTDSGSHTQSNILPTQNVHTNPVQLLQSWLVAMKHKIEIEIPLVLSGLEKELKRFESDDIITKVEVGEGLSQEMEI